MPEIGERWRDTNPYAVLTRHFFGRFFDNEFVSPSGEMAFSVTQILALLPIPGAIVGFWFIMKYAFLIAKVRVWFAVDSWGDRCFFVSVSMLVMGVATLINWDSLFLDRKDQANLMVLPVPLRTVFLAKVTSLLVFMALFSIMTNIVSGIVFPIAATIRGATALDGLRFFVAHFVCVVGGSSFVFLFLVGLQGACMTLLPQRIFQRISVIVQSSLLILILSSFFVISDLIGKVKTGKNPLYEFLFVPAWFTALYDRMIGVPSIHATSLSWKFPIIALLVAFTLSAVFYALTYRRYIRQIPESTSKSGRRIGLLERLFGAIRQLVAKEPEEAAAFDFVRMTLSRSPRHRVIMGSCLGVAVSFCLAFVFSVLAQGGGRALHHVTLALVSIPAVLTYFLLGGARFAFAIPSELGANWIFRTPPFRHDVCWNGVRKAIITLILVPVFALSLGLFVYFWGWPTALRFLLIEALAAVVLMERLFAGFTKIPFTCSYLPGKANLKLRWPVYVVSFSLYVAVTGAFAISLSSVRGYTIVIGLAVAVIWASARSRARFLRAFPPVYEDEPEPLFMDLGLSRLNRPIVSPIAPSTTVLGSKGT